MMSVMTNDVTRYLLVVNGTIGDSTLKSTNADVEWCARHLHWQRGERQELQPPATSMHILSCIVRYLCWGSELLLLSLLPTCRSVFALVSLGTRALVVPLISMQLSSGAAQHLHWHQHNYWVAPPGIYVGTAGVRAPTTPPIANAIVKQYHSIST